MFQYLETFIIFVTFNKTTLNEIFWDRIFSLSRRVHFRTWPKDHQKNLLQYWPYWKD